jgi:hypothetical protein
MSLYPIEVHLDYMQLLKMENITALVLTDSKITLQMLQNPKKHLRLIDLIRTKVTEIEQEDVWGL